jgi:hypothetical protein
VENLHHAQQIMCALSGTVYASAPFQAFHLVAEILAKKKVNLAQSTANAATDFVEQDVLF